LINFLIYFAIYSKYLLVCKFEFFVFHLENIFFFFLGVNSDTVLQLISFNIENYLVRLVSFLAVLETNAAFESLYVVTGFSLHLLSKEMSELIDVSAATVLAMGSGFVKVPIFSIILIFL
jgi:hypothetical protein